MWTSPESYRIRLAPRLIVIYWLDYFNSCGQSSRNVYRKVRVPAHYKGSANCFLQFALLFATFFGCTLTIVEDIDQQALGILHDADIAAESSVCHAVPARLHHELPKREVHHVPRFGLQCFL